MDYTDRIDPNNRRTENLRRYVTSMRALLAQVAALEPKRISNTLTPPESVMLANCYFQLGRVLEAARLIRPLADKENDPQELQVMAQIFLAARLNADAEKALQKFLTRSPNSNADLWLELAKIQHRAGKKQASQQSFVAAYKIDKNGVFAKLQRDQELQELAMPLFQKR